MSDNNNDQYLWDGHGDDSAVAEMEALLAPLKHEAPLRMRWRRPWLRAIITALCGATLFFALFAQGRAPARFVGLFHSGPVSELTIHGGSRVELSVEGGEANRALNESVGRALNARGARFDFASDASLVVELPETPPEAARAWALQIAAEGNFTMHKVLEGSEFMEQAFELAREQSLELGVTADNDYWMHEGKEYLDLTLRADSRQALVDAFEHWQESGELTLPDGNMLAYESYGSPDSILWRSYLLDSTAELSQDDFADSYMYWRGDTNQPEVLIEFTEAGRSRFADLTRSMVGKKIAFVLDDDVRSAPTVQAEITGGSTAISMGGSNRAVAQAEAQALAAVLRGPSLPAKVSIASIDEVAPEVSSASMVAARGFMALGVGLFLFLFAWPLERLSRRREPLVGRLRSSASGKAARLRPALVTLLGMTAVAGLSRLWLPGTEEVLGDIAGTPSSGTYWTAIGILPFLTGAVIAELVAWLSPAWRQRRGGDEVARAPIEKLGLVLGLLFLAAQAYFYSAWLSGLVQSSGDLGIFALGLPELDMRKILVSLVAGSALLYALAKLISRYGLGNGFAIVIAAGIIPLLPEFWSSMTALSAVAAFEFFRSFLFLIGALLLTAFLVKQSVRFGDGMQVTLPAAGIAPLTVGPVLYGFYLAITGAFNDDFTNVLALDDPEVRLFQLLSVVALSVVLTLFALRMPRGSEETRVVKGLRAGLRPYQLLAAVGVSLAFPLALLLATRTHESSGLGYIIPLSLVVYGTGLAMDLFGEFRARYRNPELVPVWNLQRTRYLVPIVGALDHAGIDSFVRGRYLRVLLSVIGPFVPMCIMVPEHRASEARDIIQGQV